MGWPKRPPGCYLVQIANLEAKVAACEETERLCAKLAESNQGLEIELTDIKVRLFAWRDALAEEVKGGLRHAENKYSYVIIGLDVAKGKVLKDLGEIDA